MVPAGSVSGITALQTPPVLLLELSLAFLPEKAAAWIRVSHGLGGFRGGSRGPVVPVAVEEPLGRGRCWAAATRQSLPWSLTVASFLCTMNVLLIC